MLKNEIDNLEIYRESMKLADQIWHLVVEWTDFPRETIGYQIIRSSDSIAAHISEGYGRYFYKEHRQYFYIARGSLYETKTFVIKAKNRKLINLADYNRLSNTIENLIVKLNGTIQFVETQMKIV